KQISNENDAEYTTAPRWNSRHLETSTNITTAANGTVLIIAYKAQCPVFLKNDPSTKRHSQKRPYRSSF
ncbi:hypothetical protein OAF34_06830, partial [Pirellulaceae bacterium]|nr:hypothetical protein [Pirellulaceae bacterium]